MQLSIWTYPWDIQEQGAANLIGEVTGKVGLSGISMATSYHAGRFLQPRSPRQKAYFPEDGTVYYRVDPRFWEGAEIRPLESSIVASGGDMLAALVAAREESGISINCWTVCLHNTRLGMLHPQHVTRNAFGNPNYYNLCPSSPAARDYVVRLVREITTRYRPDSVELESPNFLGFVHEYHHEKDMVGILPEDDFLLSLCFCPHCMARATAAGVDAEAARARVEALIEAMCQRLRPEAQFPGFPAAGIEAFARYPELVDYLRWRSEPVTSLIGEIRAAADPASKILLIDLKDGWLGGVDLEACGKLCDGAILCCYSMTPEEGAKVMAEGRRALGPEKYLGMGLRLYYPEVDGPEILSARALAALRAGAEGVNFYNYGLLPEPRLDWIKSAVEACKREG